MISLMNNSRILYPIHVSLGEAERVRWPCTYIIHGRSWCSCMTELKKGFYIMLMDYDDNDT